MTTSELLEKQLAEATRAGAVGRTLDDGLRRMMDSVRPEGIFGPAVERDGVTVIPCAEVSAGFGMGGGGGFGPAPANQSGPGAASGAVGAQPSDGAVTAAGSGMGGGGGATGRPVAMIVISQGQARVQPVVDVTKLAIAALTTLGFSAFMVSQMLSPRGRRGARAVSFGRFARAARG
jgi:uncharacterized spore protein YtfJ